MQLRFAVQAISDQEIAYLRASLFSEPHETPIKRPRLSTQPLHRPTIYLQNGGSDLEREYFSALCDVENKNRQIQEIKRRYRELKIEVNRLEREEKELKAELNRGKYSGL